VLTIESAEPNYFTREHERILNVLGNQLAVALENARLYEQLRQRTSEMETLLEMDARSLPFSTSIVAQSHRAACSVAVVHMICSRSA